MQTFKFVTHKSYRNEIKTMNCRSICIVQMYIILKFYVKRNDTEFLYQTPVRNFWVLACGILCHTVQIYQESRQLSLAVLVSDHIRLCNWVSYCHIYTMVPYHSAFIKNHGRSSYPQSLVLMTRMLLWYLFAIANYQFSDLLGRGPSVSSTLQKSGLYLLWSWMYLLLLSS